MARKFTTRRSTTAGKTTTAVASMAAKLAPTQFLRQEPERLQSPTAELSAQTQNWAVEQILRQSDWIANGTSVKDAEQAIITLEILGFEDRDRREYRALMEVAGHKPEMSPYKPEHYLAQLYGGSGAIYRTNDPELAGKIAAQDAGTGNLKSFRQATEEEYDWHVAMNGAICTVENPDLKALEDED